MKCPNHTHVYVLPVQTYATVDAGTRTILEERFSPCIVSLSVMKVCSGDGSCSKHIASLEVQDVMPKG